MMTEWQVDPVIDWLLTEGRLTDDFNDMTNALGERLSKAGAPVCRIRVGMRTLHPLVAAISAIWERNIKAPELLFATHGMEGRSEYKGSPLAMIASTGQSFRRRLFEDLGSNDHHVLHELKAAGVTDYYGCMMEFSGEKRAIFVVNSDAPKGFSEHDIAAFDRLAKPLAPVTEVYSHKLITSAIADAYLGTRTGKLVLDGHITRGDVTAIDAAILISDLRDWTGLNTRLQPREAVGLVNSYFELVSEAVEAEGGEVLKFIGDGILAIFSGDTGGTKTACSRALKAACRAIDLRQETGLSFGIGLHSGEVLYGNVGSKTRIDFTVLGQAVNIASRIEALCPKLDLPLLYSSDIAERLDQPSRQVSTEILKGHSEPFPIFTIDTLPDKA